MQDTNPPEPTIPTTNNFTCSASCHMRGMTFAVYDVCRSVSAKSGKMYCSAEFIANRYEGMSQSTVYKHLAILRARGWLILTKERVWLSDGTTSTNQFRVLKHEEWASAYPGKCEPPVKKTKNRPSLRTGEGSQPSPIGGDTFTNLRSHLHSELVSNLKEPNLKERTLKNTSGIAKPSLNLGEGGIAYGQQIGNPSPRMAQPSPVLSEGAVRDTPTAPDVDALQDRFTRLRRKKETPSATAPTGPTPARRLALRLTGTLGIGSPTAIQGWESVIGRLLAQHPFADVEQAAIYVAVHQARFMRLPDGPDSGAQGFETHFPTVLKKAREMQSAERTVA